MRIPAIYFTHLGEKVKGFVVARHHVSGNIYELEFEVSARKSRWYKPRQKIRTSESFTIPRDAFKIVNRLNGAWIRTREYSWERYFSIDN